MEIPKTLRGKKTDGPKDRFLAYALILLAANFLLRLIAAAVFPLFYKEAYFWEWSRFLSTGYLEHPPLIAWLIRATQVFSSEPSAYGLRLGAVLLGTCSLGLVYLLSRELFGERRIAFRSLGIAAGLPLLNIVGVWMLPDTPLLFFHLLFLWLFVRALHGRKNRDWLLAGLALGLALLSKLMAVLTLFSAALFLISSPPPRFWLKRKQPYLALFLSLLGLFPYLCWNAAHHFVTLRFYLWDRQLGEFGFSVLKLGEAVGEQLEGAFVFLLLPLMGIFLIKSRILPEEWQSGFRLLRYQAATVFVFFFSVGSVTQTRPHWTILAYPSLATALAAVSTLKRKLWLTRRLAPLASLSHLALILLILLAIFGPSQLRKARPQSLGEKWSKKVALAQQMSAWKEVERKLKLLLPQSSGNVRPLLFMDDYRKASLFSFGKKGDPVINLNPFFRRRMIPGNGQAFYLPWKFYSGRNGYFLTESRKDVDFLTKLRRVFAEVGEPAPFEIEYAGGQVIPYRIIEVKGFHPERSYHSP